MDANPDERPLPPTLFKYRSLPATGLGHVADIIKRNELFFASATAFNDPFDSAPYLSVRASAKARRRYFERQALNAGYTSFDAQQAAARITSLPDRELDQFAQAALASALEKIAICSLATRNDHVLMWSHYASNHSGLCLAFDVTRGGFAPYGPFPVAYQNARPVYDVFNAGDGPFQHMLTKAQFWAYEEEWRLVATDEAGPGAKPIGDNSLSAIYLGCAISDAHRRETLALASTRSTAIRVFQMRASKRTFDLMCERIA